MKKGRRRPGRRPRGSRGREGRYSKAVWEPIAWPRLIVVISQRYLSILRRHPLNRPPPHHPATAAAVRPPLSPLHLPRPPPWSAAVQGPADACLPAPPAVARAPLSVHPAGGCGFRRSRGRQQRSVAAPNGVWTAFVLLLAGVALTAGFQLGWGPLPRRHALPRVPRPLHAVPPSPSGNGDRGPKRTGRGDGSRGSGNGSSSSRRPPPQPPRAGSGGSSGGSGRREGRDAGYRGGGRPPPMPPSPSSSSSKPPFKRPGGPPPPPARVVVGRALLAIRPGDSEAILALLDENRDRLNPADCTLALKR